VFFEHDKGKTHSSGKLLFSARIIPYRGSWLDFEFDPKDILYFRVDRRRKMPVTILLKAIGLTPESILAHFFVTDSFRLMDTGAQMEFVADRLRGEVARFDITDKQGNVIVEKDKRITARHVRQLEQTGTQFISVPEDFLVGRIVARNMVDAESGEIVAKANDELTEALLKKLRTAGIKEIQALYTNELDEGAYISQTLAKQPYLTGQTFTIADAYLFVILNWTGYHKVDLKPWPALTEFQARIAKRPAVQATLKIEGLVK